MLPSLHPRRERCKRGDGRVPPRLATLLGLLPWVRSYSRHRFSPSPGLSAPVSNCGRVERNAQISVMDDATLFHGRGVATREACAPWLRSATSLSSYGRVALHHGRGARLRELLHLALERRQPALEPRVVRLERRHLAL